MGQQRELLCQREGRAGPAFTHFGGVYAARSLRRRLITPGPVEGEADQFGGRVAD